MIRIKSAEIVKGFHVQLTFTDGSQRVVDLSSYLRGPVFEEIRQDPLIFRALQVDPELGTLVWPNGADIDPDVLIFDLKPAWQETTRAPQH